MLIPLLFIWAWASAHSDWECAPGAARVILYSCASVSGFVPGQDITAGVGVIGPAFAGELDPLRRQRMADQRRVDALLLGSP